MFNKKNFNAKLLPVSLLLLFVLAGANSAFSQGAPAPEQTAQDFYKWYLQELAASKNPFKQKQKMLQSVSKRLNRWIYSKAYEEYGADYFIDAQDFDDKWVVTTSKAVIKGNGATLKVTLALPNAKKSDWKQTLLVKMVRENGAWKIDGVNDRKFD